MAQILIRTPEELKGQLQSEAQRMGVTLNAIVLQILWGWAEKRKQGTEKNMEGEEHHED